MKYRKELEKRIINAIRWIGASTHSGSDCDKFLMFVIAIECLLIKLDEEGKSSPIAERCAFLLSDKPEKRIQIDREMKDLYNTRSEIVREGLTDYGRASWFRTVVINLLLICIMQKIKRW